MQKVSMIIVKIKNLLLQNVHKMKKILILFYLILNCSNVFSVSAITEVTDTIAFMQELVDFGNRNKGASVALIVNRFRNQGIHIKHFSYNFTSPFIDPEGKCYLKSIIISYQRPNQKNWPVLTIYINETNCESENFEDNMKAYEGNGEQRADRIKNLFTIKKVEFDFWPVDYSKTDNH